MIGVSYTVAPKARTPQEITGNLVYPDKSKQETHATQGRKTSSVCAQNIRRLASLEGSKKEVMEELVCDADKWNPAHSRPWVVVMDRALHLWSLVATVSNKVDYVGILDTIHVVEYLWDVANALNGEKHPNNRKWGYDHLLAILQGRVGWVMGN